MDTAREWAVGERDPSELYRGVRLASALDWTTGHTLELNELEREFLSASREASQREAERQRRTNRRLRGLLAGVAVFLVVALIAGGIALLQRGKARRSAEVADAQRLGSQAVVAGRARHVAAPGSAGRSRSTTPCIRGARFSRPC